MTMLLEFLERHRARHLFRSSHLKQILILTTSYLVSLVTDSPQVTLLPTTSPQRGEVVGGEVTLWC